MYLFYFKVKVFEKITLFSENLDIVLKFIFLV